MQFSVRPYFLTLFVSLFPRHPHGTFSIIFIVLKKKRMRENVTRNMFAPIRTLTFMAFSFSLVRARVRKREQLFPPRIHEFRHSMARGAKKCITYTHAHKYERICMYTFFAVAGRAAREQDNTIFL